MEDALVQVRHRGQRKDVLRLNPCFNGRCTRTFCPLHHCETLECVLILVLMEDALVHQLGQTFKVTGVGLNPCFNGRCTRT